MTTTGFLFLLFSVGFVTGLCGWCYYRVLRSQR
jgi:hypothetical protein